MAQISKYPIPKSVADRIFDVFIKSISNANGTKEAQSLAYDLFTPVERIMLAKRLAVAFLLLKGYSHREICRIIRVSLGMIAGVNEKVKYGNSGYKTILEKIARKEALEDFFEGIIEGLVSIPARGTKGGGAWRYLKNEIQKERGKKNSTPF